MFKKIETNGYIRKIEKSFEKSEESINLSKRDLELAKSIKDKNSDWAFNIAYNSILQMVRALMYIKGYRPASRSSHISSVKFAELYLNTVDTSYFDRMRKNRHEAVYDKMGTISNKMAEKAILRAEEINLKLEKIIEKEHV